MEIPRQAVLLRIFIGEDDHTGMHPLYEAIVLKARAAHLAGATVLRGPLGFGAASHLHQTHLLRPSRRTCRWSSKSSTSAENINAFLPQLDGLIDSGLVTLENVPGAPLPASTARQLTVAHRVGAHSFYFHAQQSSRCLRRVGQRAARPGRSDHAGWQSRTGTPRAVGRATSDFGGDVRGLWRRGAGPGLGEGAGRARAAHRMVREHLLTLSESSGVPIVSVVRSNYQTVKTICRWRQRVPTR